MSRKRKKNRKQSEPQKTDAAESEETQKEVFTSPDFFGPLKGLIAGVKKDKGFNPTCPKCRGKTQKKGDNLWFCSRCKVASYSK